MYRFRGRVLFGALAILSGAAGLAGAGSATAVSADLSASIASHPDTVSPPGGLALYRVTVSNAGKRAFTDVPVLVVLAAGAQVHGSLTGNACSNPSADGVTLTCTLASVPPNGSAPLDVFATTPTTPGTYTTKALLTESSKLPKNAVTVSTTTAVINDPSKSSGFFLPGAHGVGNQVLHVPLGGGKGVVAKMALEDHTAFCGATCIFSGQAVRVDFPLQDPTYSALDPLHPITVELDMGLSAPPCRGLGGTCDDLGFDKFGQVAVVPFCNGASGTNAGPPEALPSSPCKYHQFKSDDGHVHFEVALLSNDPTFF